MVPAFPVSPAKPFAAQNVRLMPQVWRPEMKDGAGNAGRSTHPQPRVQQKKQARESPQVRPIVRHSLRDGVPLVRAADAADQLERLEEIGLFGAPPILQLAAQRQCAPADKQRAVDAAARPWLDRNGQHY